MVLSEHEFSQTFFFPNFLLAANGIKGGLKRMSDANSDELSNNCCSVIIP